MTKCIYDLMEDLEEFDEQYDHQNNLTTSVGYCDNCNKWFDIIHCICCQHEKLTEITDKEIIQDLENDYFKE